MNESAQVKAFQTALLLGVYFQHTDRGLCEVSLNELERLADTYGLQTVDKVPIHLRQITASTFIGKGKLQELAALLEEYDIDLVLLDEEVSPHQQRNLEKALKKPVMDRTELIIEVFAKRAQSKEARLQVELAKIRYQLPRLKRLWTHLSRQVSGGGGFLKGEGEKQIELDRRILRHRIVRLEKEVEEVHATRQTQRGARLRRQIPTFAIVGYTNAGKSTLLRALTHADVLVEDKLFATLDTATRKYILPNKQEILLVDTVGFIKKIPHTLVAAFKSTLEEAIYTDALIHLVDASSPEALGQAEATLEVLEELGAKDRPMLTVLNKIDRCEDKNMLLKLRVSYPRTIAISALEGQGFTELLARMIEVIASLRKKVHLSIPQSHYSLVSELMRDGHVLSIEYEENNVLMEVELSSALEKKVTPFLR